MLSTVKLGSFASKGALLPMHRSNVQDAKGLLFAPQSNPKGDQFQKKGLPTPLHAGRTFLPRFGNASEKHLWDYGTQVIGDKVRFKLWAPAAETVELLKIDPLTPQEIEISNKLHDLKDEKKHAEVDLEHKAQLHRSSQVSCEELQEFHELTRRLAEQIQENENRLRKIGDRVVKAVILSKDSQGNFYLDTSHPENDFKPGSLYMYRLKYADQAVSKPLPDYRSQSQPEDVHGPSQIVDPHQFVWEDQNWKTPQDIRKLVSYRLHVGTFTPEGTLKAASQQLQEEVFKKGTNPDIVEVMPVTEFAGKRNWGYDLVGYYAVENAYGHPDDFRRFVNEMHKQGKAVILDMVYNHIGPEGAYFSQFAREFARPGITPWGNGFNYDNPQVKQFVLDNVKFWVKAFHVDGFRFDMTKEIRTAKEPAPTRDDIIRDITAAAYQAKKEAFPNNPHLLLIAEDGRNANRTTLPHDWKWKDHDVHEDQHGLGMTAQWNFDFHHAAQSVVTGYSHMGGPTDAAGLADVLERGFRWPEGNWNRLLEQAVNFTQSHDEIGNWEGARIYPKVGAQRARLSAVLKYLVPGLPMTFAGEEYGEQNPFYYFVNHSDPLLVKDIEENKKRNGNPQPLCTTRENFESSKLSWKKDEGLYQMNRDIIRLRHLLPAMWEGGREQMRIDRSKLGSNVILLHRWGKEHPNSHVFIAINCSGYNYKFEPEKQQHGFDVPFPPGFTWKEVLNTDNTLYGGEGSTNAGRLLNDNTAISLPPWGVAIFSKASCAKAAEA